MSSVLGEIVLYSRLQSQARAPSARIVMACRCQRWHCVKRGGFSNTAAKGVPTVDAAIDQLKSGEIDAFGMSRDELVRLSAAVPGSHVLPGRFFEVSIAIAVPKGHAAALEFATVFIEDAKRSLLMRRIFDANGLHDQAVAP